MTTDAPVPGVTAGEAADLVEAGALLVDVREAHEWHAYRIRGAEWLPMSTINDWYGDLPQDRTIVVYCHTGVRSHSVTAALTTQADMANIVNLVGGIAAWEESGLPIDSGMPA